MHLARFPRVFLAHLPTPLEKLDRLSKELGGPEIWIKRDDCTGLATGGNKTRKLEFLMAEAVAMGADIVITQGATQSNHARQTAAAAARLGLDCHILLEDRVQTSDSEYYYNGNVLLDRLHGATVEAYPGGLDMNAQAVAVGEAMRKQGRNPYVIPGGGSMPQAQWATSCVHKNWPNKQRKLVYLLTTLLWPREARGRKRAWRSA